jgi:hypothetical protein
MSLNMLASLLGVVLLVRVALKRRRGLFVEPAGHAPRPAAAPDRLGLALKRAAFVFLLVFSLTVPSNWTQDVPARYGTRHAGLQHSLLYPRIDTAPPVRSARIQANLAGDDRRVP